MAAHIIFPSLFRWWFHNSLRWSCSGCSRAARTRYFWSSPGGFRFDRLRLQPPTFVQPPASIWRDAGGTSTDIFCAKKCLEAADTCSSRWAWCAWNQTPSERMCRDRRIWKSGHEDRRMYYHLGVLPERLRAGELSKQQYVLVLFAWNFLFIYLFIYLLLIISIYHEWVKLKIFTDKAVQLFIYLFIVCLFFSNWRNNWFNYFYLIISIYHEWVKLKIITDKTVH